MYAGKASVFDAVTVHLDEVETMAPGTTVLAANAQSEVQAAEITVDGVTLPKAANEFGLAPKTVITLGRSALRKQKNGRYVAKKIDQLLRVVNVLTIEGRKEIAPGSHPKTNRGTSDRAIAGAERKSRAELDAAA